jgi:hypothetical protein
MKENKQKSQIQSYYSTEHKLEDSFNSSEQAREQARKHALLEKLGIFNSHDFHKSLTNL